MTPAAFQSWITRMGFPGPHPLDTGHRQAANALGVSKRVINYYLAGDLAIPRKIELACQALEAERSGSAA